MVGISESLQNGLQEAFGSISEFVSEHPIGTAIGTAGVVGAGVGIVALTRSKTKRKTRKKTKKGHKRDRRFKSKQKHEQRYKRKRKYKIYGRKGYINPKRKGSSRRKRGVRYTKNGQPYVILSDGRARFIKGKRRHK